MLRSTRRVLVAAVLCLGLGLSFVAVASAGNGNGASPRSEGEEVAAAATVAEPSPEPDPTPSEVPDEPESEGTTLEDGEPDGAEKTEDAPGAAGGPDGEEGPGAAEDAEPAPEKEEEEQPEPAAEGSLALRLAGGGDLVQVGGTATYQIEVANLGDEPLHDVAVQAVVAPELDITGAEGGELSGSAVTWTLPVLAPDASQSLTLHARVARADDLRAVTEVVVKASEDVDAARGTLETFIAAARGVTVSNPEPRIFEEVTVTRPREVTVRVDDQAVAGTILPVTGVPVGWLVGAGALLVVLGLLALARARGWRRFTPARILVVCLLVLAGCTANVERPEDRAAPDTPAPATSPADEGRDEPDEEPEDEVLGTVVEPEDVDEDEDAEAPGVDVGAPDGTGEPEVSQVTEVAVQTVTVEEEVVRRRLVPVDEIPVRALGTTQGANTISLSWTGSGIDTAASSIAFDPDALAEVTTGLGASAGTVEADVTLTNLLPGQRLAVRGRFVHEVAGPGGLHAVLRSERVDLVLNPDGTTTYRFAYALPAGDYVLTSRFEADA